MMRLSIILVVAGVLVAAFLASPANRTSPPPLRPAADPPSAEDRPPDVPTGEPATTEAAPRPAETHAPPATTPQSALADLLETLRLRRGTAASVDETLDEIAALLREHPGLIRQLLDEVAEADRGYLGLLVHAVRRSESRRLMATLDAAIAAAADPGEKLVKELLASDPDRIALALQDLERPQDRLDLVQGLSRDQVTDPRIVEALISALDHDPDPRVRRSTLIRLGKSGVARARARVARVLHDPVAPEKERAAAALALGGSAARENYSEFVAILERGKEPVSVMVLAANGLSQVVGRSEVDKVLFASLASPEENDRVRKAAAGSIALGGQRLKGRARDDLEERVIGTLHTLSGQAGSEMVYAWSRSQFLDSFGSGFRRRFEPSADTRSSVISTGD